MDAATDAYAVLGVREGASYSEIRAAYLALARIHHPDKAQPASGADDGQFRVIHTAYETLRSADARADYTRRRSALLARTHAASQPRIAETVDLDAFEPQEHSDGSLHFIYPCRCGQAYVFDAQDAAKNVDHVACTGCSEVIRIVWE